MTLPDNRPVRKPRRLGLIIPWALAAVLVVAWSIGWLWLKGETERRMDAARASMAQSGWRLDWSRRKVSGFPFRLNVDLTNARWGQASGLSVTAPVLNAQAYVSRTDNWMLVAPNGLVLSTHNEPVTVTAKILRASLSELERRPARVSVEGIDLRLAGKTVGEDCSPVQAKEFHLHTRAGPSDQGAAYLEIDRATSAPNCPSSQPLTVILDGIYSHASSLSGRDWPSAVKTWKAAGGKFEARHVHLQNGDAIAFDGSPGVLALHGDGVMEVGLRQSGRPALNLFVQLY